jgi:hypothetical protein
MFMRGEGLFEIIDSAADDACFAGPTNAGTASEGGSESRLLCELEQSTLAGLPCCPQSPT